VSAESLMKERLEATVRGIVSCRIEIFQVICICIHSTLSLVTTVCVYTRILELW
jgi:hypothetical protein